MKKTSHNKKKNINDKKENNRIISSMLNLKNFNNYRNKKAFISKSTSSLSKQGINFKKKKNINIRSNLNGPSTLVKTTHFSRKITYNNSASELIPDNTK